RREIFGAQPCDGAPRKREPEVGERARRLHSMELVEVERGRFEIGADAEDSPYALQHSARVDDDDPMARNNGAANTITVEPHDEWVERRRLPGEPSLYVRSGGRRHASPFSCLVGRPSSVSRDQ